MSRPRPVRTTRIVAAAALLGLALTACSSGTTPLDGVPVPVPTDSSGTDGTPGDGTTTPGGSPSASPGGTTDPTPTSPGPTAGPSSSPGAALTAANDRGGVGSNARAMLRGDRPGLVVEIDVQQGVRFGQDAVDHLVAVLGRVLDKPGGIRFAGGNTFASDRTAWSTDDLRAAAAANRSTATTDTEVSVHVLYVAGGHQQDGEQTSAIGIAFSASEVALFPDRWQGISGLLGSSAAVERAVLVHEFGHLLSLVNIGYRSDIDHEDPDHPGHSSNQQSVMFHAIESTLIGQVFSGPPPDDFDDADRADLEGLRTGRL